MDLTITLPAHVAAAFTNVDEAAAWCLAAATDHAREQALAAARDEVQATLAAAAAPFDGTEPPDTPTLAERVAGVNQRIDRVPTLAVALATEAGVAPERAAEIVAQVVDG